jgi:alpha-beta hydrolase superfamily lysophospholipase
MSETPDTIVLIHGLWMTPRSWENWAARYESRGYKVLTPAWPGLAVEVEALIATRRRSPSSTSLGSSTTTSASSASSTARPSSWATRSAAR